MKKTIAETYTEQVHIVHKEDINGKDVLYGGVLLSWIDMTSVIVGRRYTGMNVTTAAIDNLQFLAPAHVNDMIVLCGSVTYAGNTSFEVRVDTYIETLNGDRRMINKAYIVLVALDDNGAPQRVPELTPETDEEKEEYFKGEKRRELRKIRAEEKF